jgi:hypothetical protein
MTHTEKNGKTLQLDPVDALLGELVDAVRLA